jgi:hypothetical protein
METKTAIETNVQAIAPVETVKVPTVAEEDLEAKNVALEAEKAHLIEERDNYKFAYLKKTRKEQLEVNDEGIEETQDEKLRRITREELANSRIADIAREQDVIIKKALRENKELKLAQLNKTKIPPASVGTSNESTPVTSTSITPEQMAYFKSKKFTDKDIERYKKNLQKGGGR